MLKLSPKVTYLGRLSLFDELTNKPIGQLDELSVAFRADSATDFIAKSWQYKFDGAGHVDFFSQLPDVDLAREFEAQDYLLRFTVSTPGYQTYIHTATISAAHWSDVVDDAEQSTVALFDESIDLTPNAVTAQVSVYRTDAMAITPADLYLKITSPESAVMDGSSISDVLAIWSFNPLPLTTAITVTVFSAQDDSELGSKALTIDYSQAVNRWEIPVTV